jgi:cephalosporin-C deacetylase-like acetyl esterase
MSHFSGKWKQTGATAIALILIALFLIGVAALGMSPFASKPAPAGETDVTIRTYLCREAAQITDGAVHDLTTARAWNNQRPKKLQQYYEMLGIDHLMAKSERPPLNVKVTGVLDREKYRIEKLYYESLPKLYVTANLYVPKGLKGRAPGVLYVCGHSPGQKVPYQPHARRWAELGFVTLIIDSIQLGEIRGFHHGCYREGWWNWYSRGYTPAGVECWNGIRGIDLLQSRPEVDPDRIGVTGISGGGANSWWIGAADERVKVVAPVCGTGTIKSHVAERTVDGHCDCMYYINYYGWDLSDVGALIAPRPLLVASANRDGLFTIESIKDYCDRVEKVYKRLGVGDRFQFVETPGPHSYHKISRTAIFSWFMKHLMNSDVNPEAIADVDERNEAEKDLVVYGDNKPADEKLTTVQDWFIPKAEPPAIADKSSLEKERKRIVDLLAQRTFHQFPAKPCPLNSRVTMRNAEGNSNSRILFASEDGIELVATFAVPKGAQEQKKSPCMVFLRSPRSKRGEAEGIAGRLSGAWTRLIVNTRGVWETSWSDDQQWHLRRAAAIAGRTIASMRVYDALRALELARALPEVDPAKVAIGGDGEMAVVAAYAALLDGKVSALVLSNPPASLDLPSEKDGTSTATELLGALRIADLPVAAGLVWPARVAFVGKKPASYDWTLDLYRRLGTPEKAAAAANLGAWRE